MNVARHWLVQVPDEAHPRVIVIDTVAQAWRQRGRAVHGPFVLEAQAGGVRRSPPCDRTGLDALSAEQLRAKVLAADAMYRAQGQRVEALTERLEEAVRALRWVSARYAQTLVGESVRDADECLSHAQIVLRGEP